MAPDARPPSIPTAPPAADAARQAGARTARRLFVAALVVFLALGALDLLGVNTRSRSARGGGYDVSLTYAAVSRPGLATPWSLEVHHAGGFPDGLTVAVRSKYFDAFDVNGVSPAPAVETDDGERSIWRFAPSDAERMSISVDGAVEAGVQLTRVRGRVEILSAPDGAAVVAIGFSTLVMP